MLILNVQFWNGDKEQAMALARLIADIEPVKRTDVHMLFTARFDATHDEETIRHCSQKFNVVKFTTTRKATGWPNGPNQMAGESYQWCVEKVRQGVFPGAKAVMMIEADCVPLHVNWINILINEFTRSGKMVLGAWMKFGDANIEHINGNCIIDLYFWKKCPEICNPQERGGWDATLRNKILPNGHPSRYIWSDYQLGQDHNPWKGCDYLWAPKRYGSRDNVYYGEDLFPVWHHGCKIMAAIECARIRLLKDA